MLVRVLIVIVLLTASLASAQMPAPTALPGFGRFNCTCQPASAVFVPTPNPFAAGAPVISGWRGSVYALSDTDARLKARSACVAENRGSSTLCDTCLCAK